MSTGGGSEHRVRMPVLGAGKGLVGAKPEKQLNRFVHVVAFIERAGNALGTLAFGWATVILLGGYPTELSEDKDFWYTTTIVFLEALRRFSRNNRLDYQLFFHTKGAVRCPGWNRLIIIVYLSNALFYLSNLMDTGGALWERAFILVLLAPSVLGPFQPTRALKLLSKTAQCVVSLCSPVVAILLLVPLIEFSGKERAKWIAFSLLFVVVLLLTVSRLISFHRNTKLAQHGPANKQRIWHQSILNMCMFVELVMLVLMNNSSDDDRSTMIAVQVWLFVCLLFGNLQIPAAVTRVALSLLRLVPQDYSQDPKKHETINLAPSLNIFYVMVLIQGILYVVACMLEVFSFISRRLLARRCGLGDQWGVEFISLYYAYALGQCMEGDVLAPKKISLDSFAMYCLNSDKPKMQLYGIRIMDSLLQRELTRSRLLSKLNASMETIARLIRMLDWTSTEDTTIRLFAAKVISELAKGLRVVTIPGTMQLVSSLLDASSKPEIRSALLDANEDDDDEQEKKQDKVTVLTSNIQEQGNDPVVDVDDYPREKQDPPRAGVTSNLLETQTRSNQQVGNNDQNSCFLKCRKWFSRLRSSTLEKPLTDHDHLSLPELGMSILHSLAYDYDNCREISRAAGLIPKIIGFTSYKNDRTTNEVQHKILMESSLKLLRRLSNTSGEIGITLRCRISEHPFLLRNLAEILNDSSSSQELRKLVAGIIRNLAIDTSASLEIGRIKGIITRLMDAFLSRDAPSSTNSDQFLQKVAGQALAILTMESVGNCEDILTGPRNFVEELTSLIYRDKHKYVATRLLQHMFLHIQLEFSESGLRKLCEALGKVLENIIDPGANEAELEVLIGLGSQICRVIPGDFARVLETRHHKEMFVKRLVNALNANTNPAVHCPGVRRVIIEQAIYLMKYSSDYATVFNQYNMMEALLVVEQTPSRVERYKIFLGDVGFMEHKEPLSNLVAKANELMRRQWLKGINTMK